MQLIQNKIGWGVAGALALLLLASFAGVVRGGPLDPTSPPGSTMKTLHEVEPRTPIASLPYTITQPGSYYLTANLTCVACASSQHGVHIQADDVTLDLNGFTISGVPGSAAGIVSALPRENVTVRNGTVRDWGSSGVVLAADGAVLEGIRAIGNGWVGISVFGNNGRIANCVAEGNGEFGIFTDGTTVNINGCVVAGNADSGIHAQAPRSRIEGNTARGNTNSGIAAGSDSVVLGNIASSNSYAGIALLWDATGTQIDGNNVAGTGTGIIVTSTGNIIIRNTASGNTVDYSIGGGNTVGPIVAGSDPITTDNPWANFEY